MNRQSCLPKAVAAPATSSQTICHCEIEPIHCREEKTMSDPWKAVCAASEVLEGQAKEVVLDSRIVAIFRSQGELFALDGMCAHQGGPIAQGIVAAGCVTCPWHGWQYELATGIQTINRQPLQQTFQVREADGQIEIKLPPETSPDES
jgi:nitrite reductase/ring-hydroxylating ferredoxin subunit